MEIEGNTPPQRKSAAGLTVPKQRMPAAPPATDLCALYGRLARLIDNCGPKPNKNDLVTVLISACIAEGVNTMKAIVGLLYRLGFNNKHVAMMLKHGTGMRPESGHWRRNSDGTYRSLT